MIVGALQGSVLASTMRPQGAAKFRVYGGESPPGLACSRRLGSTLVLCRQKDLVLTNLRRASPKVCSRVSGL